MTVIIQHENDIQHDRNNGKLKIFKKINRKIHNLPRALGLARLKSF